jgi:hypothetical protein
VLRHPPFSYLAKFRNRNVRQIEKSPPGALPVSRARERQLTADEERDRAAVLEATGGLRDCAAQRRLREMSRTERKRGAREIGVSLAAVHKWMRGEARPGVDNAFACEGWPFGIPISDWRLG